MSNKKLELITDTPPLQSFCSGLRDCQYIAVDTEFLRERTYFAQLCLIQITAPELDTVGLIDPLAKDIELAHLWNILADDTILKVFHACGQDMEILYHEMGEKLPEPIFDTQVGGMFIGLGHQVGYGSMVHQLCGETLNKDKRYTDWSKRPLSDKQLEYAAADVTWLCEAYETMCDKLKSMKRTKWVEEELSDARDPKTYAPQPDLMGHRVKHRLKSNHALGIIYALAAWRENMAIKKDRPRNHIIHDNSIVKLAANPPKSQNDIETGRVKQAQSWAKDIIKEIKAIDPKNLPDHVINQPDYIRLNGEQKNIYDILNLALKCCARQHQLVPQLIASKDDLKAMVIGQGDMKTIPAMKGWRGEIFGDIAQKILNGQFFIGINDGTIEFKALK